MSLLNVQLEWNEDVLGPTWMNIDNLKSCLFTPGHTNPRLLEIIPLVSLTDSDKLEIVNALQCVQSDRCGSQEERDEVEEVLARFKAVAGFPAP